jgi:hypothetical protein
LRYSGFFDAEDGYENSRNEQHKPHGRDRIRADFFMLFLQAA